MLAVCGAALCENVEGSFLCLCASDLEEYDAQEGRCRPRAAGGERAPHSTQPLTPPLCGSLCHRPSSRAGTWARTRVMWAGVQPGSGVWGGKESERAANVKGFYPRPRNFQGAVGGPIGGSGSSETT